MIVERLAIAEQIGHGPLHPPDQDRASRPQVVAQVQIRLVAMLELWLPHYEAEHRKLSAKVRKQLLAIGARQGLAPVLDVGRDQRWGRIEETFGEDPTLVSQFGVAYIRGLQGKERAVKAGQIGQRIQDADCGSLVSSPQDAK